MPDLPETIGYDPGCAGAHEEPPARPALMADGEAFAVVTELTMGGIDGAAVCRRAAACYNACHGLPDPAALRAVLDALADACRTAAKVLDNVVLAIDWNRTTADHGELCRLFEVIPATLQQYHTLTGAAPTHSAA